jgi:hypothetical protein
MKEKNARKVLNRSRERGQSLVFIVIAMMGLLGILALSLDGGMSYAQRRAAQNAADAGVLAAVTKLCGPNPDDVAATDVAEDYAINKNRADSADVVVNLELREIEVTTYITFDTFFARLFNQTEMTVSAVAAGRCSNAALGGGMIPIAFPCLPWVVGSESEDCGIVYGSENMVILMESQSASGSYCQPEGSINCDIDGDGIPDIFDEANRGWLNLDGGNSNSAELSDWVKNGYHGDPIEPHLWVSGEPGVDTSTFHDVRDYLTGRTVFVPIFDLFCDTSGFNPSVPENACPLIYDFDIDETRVGNGHLYYRIISVAAFHITCVKSAGTDSCPFRTQVGISNSNDIKTIEGYFVSGETDANASPGGEYDTGVYVYSLTR